MFKGIIRIIISYSLILFSLFLSISLIGFSLNDALFYTSNFNTIPHNVMGVLGLKVASPFVFFYGKASIIWAIYSFVVGLNILFGISPSDLLKNFFLTHFLALMASTTIALLFTNSLFASGGILGAIISQNMLQIFPNIVWLPISIALFLMGLSGIPAISEQIKNYFHKLSYKPVTESVPSPQTYQSPEENVYDVQIPYEEDSLQYNELESQSSFSGTNQDSLSQRDLFADEQFVYMNQEKESYSVPSFLQKNEEWNQEPLFLTKKRLSETVEPSFLREVDIDLLSPYHRQTSDFYHKISKASHDPKEELAELDNINHQNLDLNNELVEKSSLEYRLPNAEKISRLSFDRIIDHDDALLEQSNKETHIELDNHSASSQSDIDEENLASNEPSNEFLDTEVSQFSDNNIGEEDDLINQEIVDENIAKESEIIQHETKFPPLDAEDDDTQIILPEIQENTIKSENSSTHEFPLTDQLGLADSEKLLLEGLQRTQERQKTKQEMIKAKLQAKQKQLAEEYYKSENFVPYNASDFLPETYQKVESGEISNTQNNDLVTEIPIPNTLSIDNDFACKYLEDEILELKKNKNLSSDDSLEESYIFDDSSSNFNPEEFFDLNKTSNSTIEEEIDPITNLDSENLQKDIMIFDNQEYLSSEKMLDHIFDNAEKESEFDLNLQNNEENFVDLPPSINLELDLIKDQSVETDTIVKNSFEDKDNTHYLSIIPNQKIIFNSEFEKDLLTDVDSAPKIIEHEQVEIQEYYPNQEEQFDFITENPHIDLNNGHAENDLLSSNDFDHIENETNDININQESNEDDVVSLADQEIDKLLEDTELYESEESNDLNLIDDEEVIYATDEDIDKLLIDEHEVEDIADLDDVREILNIDESYEDDNMMSEESHTIMNLDPEESELLPTVDTKSHLIEPTEYLPNENDISADIFEEDQSEYDFLSPTENTDEEIKEYQFPRVEDLEPNTDFISQEEESHEIEETMKMIEDTYESFNINMQVIDYSRGPTITRFEMEPPSGLKLRTIFNLQDDLALQAGTSNIRIISPVEGRSYIGIEVPNKIRRKFLLREQIESVLFQESNAELPLILGVDVGGKEIVGDLATTPHLLIAGTTGSGKSVYVNALIIGLLYKLSPEDLRFIMIDPKMVELEPYRGIPHLLAPIITKPEEAMAALEWAVQEMDRRYKILSELGVRNIKEYKQLSANNTMNMVYEKLPYIVIIVDEFANLMLRAPKDTEKHISRLASMSRAVGMHLVLATQRPSVDVVTGVIKANFPSRIAFRVSSKIDSRTILDKNGAETLLGRGDMLFMSPDYMDTMRIQSPFASSEDVARVVNDVKKNGQPEYVVNFSDLLEKEDEKTPENIRTDALSDPLFGEVLRYAVDNGEISASGIQRRFRVGYNRASRLIETMKDMKIISPPPSAGKGWLINITKDQIEDFLE